MNTAPRNSRRPFKRVRSAIKSPKVATHLVAEAKTGDRSVVVWLLDVSLEGIFIRHAEPFELGERISLEFYLPGFAGLPGSVIRCMGIVTSKVEAGKLWPAGNRLSFWVMRPAHHRAVSQFISRKVQPRLTRSTVSTVEESLLFGTLPIAHLTDISSAQIAVHSVENLPEVGALLEDLPEEESFEDNNDVGKIDPEDFVLVH